MTYLPKKQLSLVLRYIFLPLKKIPFLLTSVIFFLMQQQLHDLCMIESAWLKRRWLRRNSDHHVIMRERIQHASFFCCVFFSSCCSAALIWVSSLTSSNIFFSKKESTRGVDMDVPKGEDAHEFRSEMSSRTDFLLCHVTKVSWGGCWAGHDCLLS